jgi:hypothetical protein
LVIVPKTADRNDRVGKRTPKPIETKIDDRSTALELSRVDILDFFKDTLAHEKSKEVDSVWFIATGLEAARVLNNYHEIAAILSEGGLGNYKVFLLNPHSDLVDRDALKGIHNPNFKISGGMLHEPLQNPTSSNDTDGYHEFVENHTGLHEDEIKKWVDSKQMYKSDLDWAFLNATERFRLARVMDGILGPKSLPNVILPPEEGYPTKESILQEILKVREDGPQKELSDPSKPFGAERTEEEIAWNALFLITQAHPYEDHSNYFLGWKPEEIIAYQDWQAKNVVNTVSPVITYASWGDLLLAISNQKTPLPKEFSNREKWASQGFTALDQGRRPLCAYFARSAAMQLSMITSRFTNTALNHETNILRIAQDSENYRQRIGRFSPAQFPKSRHLGGWHPAKHVLDWGLELAFTMGIPMMNGEKIKPTQLTVRDIRHFVYNPETYPWWLKNSLERQKNECFPSGRRLHKDYEIVTGFRDEMMKHEISQGRPVVLSFAWFPITKYSHKWGPNKWATGDDGEIVVGFASHAENDVIDGHTVIAVGYKPDPMDRRKTIYECVNSWGDYWGQKGYFWFSSDLLDWMNGSRSLEIYSIEIL